jgi:transcriptional regulator with XRE-family HTH domain
MKERLLQLLDLEHLSPSKFADLIGVQRSSVSHILSDRNKPSFDFLQKTLKTFPGLKADWLMLGEGPMYEQMGRENTDLFGQAVPFPGRTPSGVGQELPVDRPLKEFQDTSAGSDILQMKQRGDAELKKIVQVMLLFDDDTFVTYKPSQ